MPPDCGQPSTSKMSSTKEAEKESAMITISTTTSRVTYDRSESRSTAACTSSIKAEMHLIEEEVAKLQKGLQ